VLVADAPADALGCGMYHLIDPYPFTLPVIADCIGLTAMARQLPAPT
jgi:hypothetical protein